MKILFDMVHPADAHFFKNCIRALRARGDDVLITSRQKDITVQLLDVLGLKHITITNKGSGLVGLFIELLKRDCALIKIATDFQPDICVTNNSPCGVHAARLLRRPSLTFDDTEIHTFNRYLYYPFVTEVHSPRCYRFRIGRKHKFYPGYHALAYLHPNHFKADPDVLRAAGLNPTEPMALIRFVEWGAMHDLGKTRLAFEQKRHIVEFLRPRLNVLISSESALPEEFEQFRLRLPIQHVHHLLAHVRFIIGESASMSSEAAVLGTPAVYFDVLGRGYTDEQEQKYGLSFNFHPQNVDAIFAKLQELVSLENPRAAFAQAHARLLSDNIDVSAYQLQQIDRLAAARD